MSNKFTNTSSGIWADFNTPATKWRFDTTGYTARVLDCTLEYLECKIYVGSYGNLYAQFEELTAECHGGGHLEATSEYLEFEAAGSTYMPAAMEATFELFIFQGYGMNDLTCTLEYLEFEAWVLFGADIECEMEPLTLSCAGSNTYVGMDLRFEYLESGILAGGSISSTLEALTFTAQAFIQVQGDIDARLQPLTLESFSGINMSNTLEVLTSILSASSPILGQLDLETQNFTSSFSAITEALISFASTLRNFQTSMQGTQVNLEDLIALQTSMETLNVLLTGINGLVADLEASFWEFDLEMIGLTDNIGYLTPTLEKLEYESIAYSGLLSDCTNVVLTYGD